MLAEAGEGFAVVGGLGDRRAMARRALAGVAVTPLRDGWGCRMGLGF